MPDNNPARRLYPLRALALASALALGGCSFLQKGADEPKPETAVGAGTATDELFQTPATASQAVKPSTADDVTAQVPLDEEHAASEGEATWDLETLQAATEQQGKEPLTLERAWYLAVKNDPDYQAAVSGRAAAETEIRLGRAAILPQVQAGYSRNKITGLQRNFLANGTTREGDLDYDSTSAYIQLQQPLFNVDRYAQFQRGKARAELGEAEFAVQEYEAAMRLTAAFVDAVAAQGRTRLARALRDSLQEQSETQEALFELNEASVVDAQETRARLALAEADLIAAEDELRVARRQLQAMIGEVPEELASIDNVEPSRIDVDDTLLYWLDRAQANSAPIRRAEAEVRVADTEVQRAAGQHLPTADLVVAYIDADSENLETLSQRYNTFQAGVQIAIPIFSGGYNTANHARARHERQQAEHELAQAREVTAAEVTRQYTAVQGGAQRIAALMSSVESGEQSLEAARRGYEYGVNSNLDVLRRQDSLFEARYELLEARVAWLEGRIALAAAAGEPVTAVFTQLDAALRVK